MSILAQLLGFIVFFILIFFTVAPMFFFSVIGAIQIRDDDDDTRRFSLRGTLLTTRDASMDRELNCESHPGMDPVVGFLKEFYSLWVGFSIFC